MNTTPKEIARHYAHMRIATAPQARAIVMLHEKSIQLIKARLSSPDNSIEHIIKAQNILAQLQQSLFGDDLLAKSLFFLYDYCYGVLNKNNEQSCRDALEILTILTATFVVLCKKM